MDVPFAKPFLAGGESEAELYALSSDSDVMYALTSYINADPEARAWLNGTPDPWGMTVNPAYQGISLPLSSWPQLDTYTPPSQSTDPCWQAIVWRRSTRGFRLSASYW